MRAATFGALHEREFRFFFVGQTVSLLGSGMTLVALSFAILDLTGSATDVGFVFAAQGIAEAAFVLVGGVLGDRLSRRTVMISSDLVQLGTQGGTAALLLTGRAQLWQLLVLQAAAGAAAASFQPATLGLLPQIVSAARLQQANALRMLTRAIGAVAGPALAGIVVVTVGPGWALAADGASFAVSAAFLAGMRVPAQERLAAQSLLRDLAEGRREWWARRWFVVANLNATLLNVLVIAPFLVLGPAVARRSLGGAGAWALIVACYGIGSIVGSLVALRLHVGRPIRFALAIGVLYAPLLALLALRLPALAVAPFAVLAGAQGSARTTLLQTTGQKLFPRELLSRLSAFGSLGSIGLAPLGFALAGLAGGTALGLSGTLWLAAALALATSLGTASTASVRTVERPKAERALPSL